MTPTEIKDWMLNDGYRAKLEESDADVAVIVSGVHGIPFNVLLLRDDPPDGDLDAFGTMSFTSGVSLSKTPSLKSLNQINANYRFFKVYADEVDDVVHIAMDSEVSADTLSQELFEDLFEIWISGLPELVNEIID